MTLTVPELPASLKISAQEALEALQDRATDTVGYRGAMHELGALLGRLLTETVISRGDRVCLAMTVEDADYLGSGAVKALEEAGVEVAVACFWNDRRDAFGFKWASMAPVMHEYVEPLERIKHLVMLKSIVSGSCLVRSNLEHLFDSIQPPYVHVAAPVMLRGADQRLAQEFPSHLSSRFRYWTFEVDTVVDEEGQVLPGIGGEVYGRLGLGDKVSKNAIFPELLKRRARAAA